MYACARAKRDNEEQRFRVYVAESLRLNPQGMYIDATFSEFGNKPVDFDPEAVVDDIAARIGMEAIA